VIVEVPAVGNCLSDRGSRDPETDTRRVRPPGAVETLGGGVSDGELITLEDNLWFLAPSVLVVGAAKAFAVLSDKSDTPDDIAENERSDAPASNTGRATLADTDMVEAINGNAKGGVPIDEWSFVAEIRVSSIEALAPGRIESFALFVAVHPILGPNASSFVSRTGKFEVVVCRLIELERSDLCIHHGKGGGGFGSTSV
jgi:hypothetical protein